MSEQSETFTTIEFAKEILAFMDRDIPETIHKALRALLSQYVATGEYVSDMDKLCNVKLQPRLFIQRVMKENAEYKERAERAELALAHALKLPESKT